jgi:hypothetical protein
MFPTMFRSAVISRAGTMASSRWRAGDGLGRVPGLRSSLDRESRTSSCRWRRHRHLHRLARLSDAALEPVKLVVRSKTNAGMGSLYRSAHELLPLLKKGRAAHVNNVKLGRHGRWRSNVWTCPGASSLGSDARKGLRSHPTVKPTEMLHDALLDLTHRDEIVLDPFLGSGSTPPRTPVGPATASRSIRSMSMSSYVASRPSPAPRRRAYRPNRSGRGGGR